MCRERGWKIADDWVVSDYGDVLKAYGRRPRRKTISPLDHFNLHLTLDASVGFAERPANWRAIVAVAEALLDCIRRNEFSFLYGRTDTRHHHRGVEGANSMNGV